MCPFTSCLRCLCSKSDKSHSRWKSSVSPKEFSLDPLVWHPCLHTRSQPVYQPHALALTPTCPGPQTHHTCHGAFMPPCLHVCCPLFRGECLPSPFLPEHSNSSVKEQLRGDLLYNLPWLPLTELIFPSLCSHGPWVQTLFSTWLHYFNYLFSYLPSCNCGLVILVFPSGPLGREEIYRCLWDKPVHFRSHGAHALSSPSLLERTNRPRRESLDQTITLTSSFKAPWYASTKKTFFPDPMRQSRAMADR